MNKKIEVVVVGGGQAGLSTSYYLQKFGRDHIVLEQSAHPANAWRADRWDSFTINTPNWSFRLPGMEYDGADPHGFMDRDEIIATFDRYLDRFQLPVECGQPVIGVQPGRNVSNWLVETPDQIYECGHVVIATGLFQRHKIPAYGEGISEKIAQLDTGQYRNPQALPPGAVLVVGSGQSGCQVAEELYQSGRQVYLCVGTAGRAPRRYRGRDIFDWLEVSGFFNRTPDKLPSPQARFAGNIQLSGKDGGHSINLNKFHRDGVVLLGKLRGASGDTVYFAPDLHENLARTDRLEADILKWVDNYILVNRIDAPKEEIPILRDAYQTEIITELNLATAQITSIIWAMGYNFDYSLVNVPVVDEFGFPITRAGVTDFPGLYFIGMPWIRNPRSGLLVGVGEDAAHIAGVICA
jgi:putative flavoprotein involved in K+ transport